MNLGLENKVALVTGGARGIGKATARAFAREGAHVGILDILEAETAQTVDEIRALGVKAAGLITDVTKPDLVNANVAHLAQELGGVHCLVNSAAVLTNVFKLEDMMQDWWQRDLDVNLTGAFNAVRAVMPIMKEQNWGSIVSISSVAGVLGGYGQAGYAATKAGLIGLMKTTALELARYNVNANTVFPGIVAHRVAQRVGTRVRGERDCVALLRARALHHRD
jgi:3-oxoacyl-[acyl-carrier protein] reductase